MANDAEVITEVVDEIGVVTINRPNQRNAVNEAVYVRLREALVGLDADPSIRAIVLTGAGLAFCAGADIREQFEDHLEAGGRVPDWSDWPGLVRAAKPVVAAVNGPAVGLGVTLILPCDRIVASTRARLMLGFVQLGLVPEMGSSVYLPRRVGFVAATELLLTGRMVGADEALGLGMVDEVVEPDDLVRRAVVVARELGAAPTRQLRWIKRLLDLNFGETNLEIAQLREVSLLTQSLRTEEHAEAVRRFLGGHSGDR